MDHQTKDTDLYLPKDQELLNQFDRIDVRTTGMGLEKKKYEINRIQLESSLRNRKTMVDLDASNKRFSMAVIFIAVVQSLIALFQFGFDIAGSDTTINKVGGFILLGFLALFIYLFFRKFFRDKV
jgi:hypothetical protein